MYIKPPPRHRPHQKQYLGGGDMLFVRYQNLPRFHRLSIWEITHQMLASVKTGLAYCMHAFNLQVNYTKHLCPLSPFWL